LILKETTLPAPTRRDFLKWSGANATDPAVIAGDVMGFNAICGGKFADIIISDLFGYAPDGTHATLRDASIARGVVATLTGSFLAGKTTITSSSTGLAIS
jgi:hypothetical protein